MASFRIKELDANGALKVSFYIAESPQVAKNQSIEKGATPIKVEEVVEGKGSMKIELFTVKPKPKDLSTFCKQMHTMLHAGMSLLESLSVLESQAENRQFRSVIRDMSLRVQKGDSFSEAMKAQKKYFPSLLVSMVKSGELTGNLDAVMERMANHFTKENKINSKIKAAMTYPAVLAFVALGALVFLLATVIPTFVRMFERSGTELPPITKFVIGVSNSIVNYWYVYIAVVGGIIFALNTIKATEGGRLFFDRLHLSIPGVRGPLTKIITSRFTRTMSTLMASGIPLLTSLETSASIVRNTYVELKVQEVRSELKKGIQLAPLLDNTGVFPPMMVSMVKIGEESGALEELLTKTADYYDEELDAAISQLMGILEPVLILVVGVLIAIIIIAMLLPMFNAFQTIGGA